MSSRTSTVPPIGTQLSRLARESPQSPAVTCDGVTLTRGELESASNRLARAYRDLGVRRGDYVTIILPNSIEWIRAAFAAWKLGAIVQPLSAHLAEPEVREILRLVPRALIVGRDDPDGLIPSVPTGFTPPPGTDDAPLEEVTSPAWKAVASGGSTGRPKLILATSNSRLDPRALGAVMGLEPDDTQLVSLPLSHNAGLSTTIMGLLLGQHIVLMPRFDPGQCLRLVTEHRVTYMVTVPTCMQRMLPVYRADERSYDLSSLRRLWHMAAPCSPVVKQAWIDLLGPDRVWELYGGTEMQAFTTIDGSDWLQHRGSVGRVVIGQMRVLDEQGAECAPGVTGEIYMRPGEGAQPTYRYIGSEAQSRDGWDSLGDLGWFSEDGYLYLNDRRVDMFTVGGRNVYPAEIEKALGDHPAVLSCLVVGVPHADLGQVPFALVEADPAAQLREQDVIEFLRGRIAPYKVPRSVEFRSRPLRDEAGKARRSAVRAELIERMCMTRDSREPASKAK